MNFFLAFLTIFLIFVSSSSFANEIIPVPTDKGIYESLSLKKPSPNTRQMVVKRTGSYGITYTEILIDCDSRTYRVLGDGETRAQMSKHKNPDKEMIPLVNGSGKFYQVEYACSK